MKVVFLSNYYTHHQKPFSEQMFVQTNGDYIFFETAKMDQERIDMGWGIKKPEYVKNFYDNEKENKKILEQASCVIFGSAPFGLIKTRIKEGKLTFKYSERPLKKGIELHKFIPRLIKWNFQFKNAKSLYLLCASAYTASDYRKFGLFKKKAFKWGYFPESKEYDNVSDLIESKEKNSILWCGRFLSLKHPELAIDVAKCLKADGYNFRLNIIGTGVNEEKLRTLIIENNLETEIKMLGSMSPEEVRKHMEKSEIYLFTSDRNEGWGAVLNESMNSACAVVACKDIGAVPYLIKDGINGYVYNYGDFKTLYQNVKSLLDNNEKRKEISVNAYKTITEEWNAKIAAERVLKLIDSYNGKSLDLEMFKEGPCSGDKRGR